MTLAEFAEVGNWNLTTWLGLATVVVAVTAAYLVFRRYSAQRLNRAVQKRVIDGEILGALLYSAKDATLLAATRSKEYTVIRYYRTSKTHYFSYKAKLGILGIVRDKFEVENIETIKKALANIDRAAYIEQFGKPDQA